MIYSCTSTVFTPLTTALVSVPAPPPAPGSVCQVQCPKIIFAHKLCPLFNYFKLRARILFATFCRIRIRSRILRLRCYTPTHTWATVTTVVHSMRRRRRRRGEGDASAVCERCIAIPFDLQLNCRKKATDEGEGENKNEQATVRQTDRQTELGPSIDTCTTVVAGG